MKTLDRNSAFNLKPTGKFIYGKPVFLDENGNEAIIQRQKHAPNMVYYLENCYVGTFPTRISIASDKPAVAILHACHLSPDDVFAGIGKDDCSPLVWGHVCKENVCADDPEWIQKACEDAGFRFRTAA